MFDRKLRPVPKFSLKVSSFLSRADDTLNGVRGCAFVLSAVVSGRNAPDDRYTPKAPNGRSGRAAFTSSNRARRYRTLQLLATD